MNKLKSRLINYYDDLKRQIDIECEQILLDSTESDTQKQIYNSHRAKIINEIDQTSKINLQSYVDLDLKDNDFENQDQIDLILFKNKFCFYVPSKLLNEESKIRMGKLIITSEFIKKQIIDFLNSFGRYDPNFNEINPRDRLLTCILGNLIIKKYSDDPIIDISILMNNNLEKFELNAGDYMSNDDLDLLDNYINIKNLIQLNIEYGKISKISKLLLTRFEHVQNLVLRFHGYHSNEYETSLLFNFKNLQKLKVVDFEVDFDVLFDGLDNLTELEIRYNHKLEISGIKEKMFEKLPKLKHLNLFSIPIKTIEKSYFYGLNDLKFLFIEYSHIDYFPNDAFCYLKNLTCLAMILFRENDIDIECLNSLSNLEILMLSTYPLNNIWKNFEKLILPKLRYIYMTSKYVPVFQNLKLNCICLEGLEKLSDNSFENQNELKVISLYGDKAILNNLKKDQFSKLKNLVHLQISVQCEKIEYVLLNNRVGDYKCLLNKPFSRFNFNYTEDYTAELLVSIYETNSELINHGLEISQDMKNILNESDISLNTNLTILF